MPHSLTPTAVMLCGRINLMNLHDKEIDTDSARDLLAKSKCAKTKFGKTCFKFTKNLDAPTFRKFEAAQIFTFSLFF